MLGSPSSIWQSLALALKQQINNNMLPPHFTTKFAKNNN